MEKTNQAQKKGRKTEKSSAQRIGGRCIPNSGAISGMKGDFERIQPVSHQDDWLIEHKHTDKKSFRVSTKTLRKIAGEAYRANKKPALMVHFDEGETYLVFRVCDTDWEE